MPVSFTPIANKDKWAGSAWIIEREDTLADLVARVALGQSRHVAKILNETGCDDIVPHETAFAGARRKLSVATGQKPYHRDGWLFQVISWIAAHRQSPDDFIRAPQMIHADKGFDGIHVRYAHAEGRVATVIICEEKATTSPRGKITNQVWPEFESLEAGERDNELVAAVSELLAMNGLADQADRIVVDILWQDARSYRVSVTGTEEHCSTDGLKKLFKGYEKKVSGDLRRRRAEVLQLDDIRGWLNGLADMALAKLAEMEAVDV
jgi:hypothetical protein